MKYRSNSILAHIPQNHSGELVLRQALFFREKLGMRIFLMKINKSNTFFPINPNSKKNKIRHEKALDQFTNFVKDHLQTEIPDNIILRVKWGKVIKTLIIESEEGGHEFVVLDKSEKHNAEDLSRADINRYISKSYCPVLSINKNYPTKKIKKIVIPIDITQGTKKRLYWTTFFAKKLNAKVHIVSALNVDIKESKSLAYKKAEKIKEMLQKRGVECDINILKMHGRERHQAILEYIEEVKPDMIILRTHRESRFTGKKIGTFVSEIVHNCQMPTFTVGGINQDLDPDSI
ncbi:universal stress protein [uncultured Draconibacterium sp.]|uniref:universal stress protein n=1 Tax=uncultured Draconibacterium sp. TaxID=1573823 RepID=UPI0029C751F1|nr:universal stress protein [uncultured Draconibacterium sp.]